MLGNNIICFIIYFTCALSHGLKKKTNDVYAESTVKFYLNNCISNFTIDNSHAYWGEFIEDCPDFIDSNTVGTFIMSYSKIPFDGSINSGNLNYHYINEDNLRCLYHQWWTISDEGSIMLNISPSTVNGSVHYDHSVSNYACYDQTDGTTNQTFVSVWLYYNDTDTIDTCQSKTSTISPTCTPAPVFQPPTTQPTQKIFGY